MAEAVRVREEMHSTALDIGVALLHPRRPLASILSEPLLALGRTNQGIPFGGDGCLTDVFFLICSTDDRGHLRTLARLSRLIADSSLLEALRAAPDAAEARQVVNRFENALNDLA
jgi:PTS system nitrogen regulatory IIA component